MAKRREKGDGSIYQRASDKKWVAYAKMENGKKRYVYGNTKGEASKKLKELQRNIENQTLVTAKPETVEDFLRYWLTIHSAKIKETTVINYKTQINLCIPHIGYIKLQKLTGEQVQKMYVVLREKRKQSTIHLLHIVLKIALNDAVRWKRITRNPLNDIDAPNNPHEERPFLNEDQCKLVLKAAKDTDIEYFLTMALTTGMRRGEMLGLRWADIDMEHKFLSVQRTASFLNSISTGKFMVVETSPKTKTSKRFIRLTDFLLTVLKTHKKRQLEMRLQAGREWVNKDLVFCTTRGEHFLPARLIFQYKKLLKENNLPQIHVHDLRHSAATLLAGMGIPAKVIQEILGHASVMTTQNLYGHVIEGMQEEAMKKMDALFQENGTK